MLRQHASAVMRPSSGLYKASLKSAMDFLVPNGIPLCLQWNLRLALYIALYRPDDGRMTAEICCLNICNITTPCNRDFC
jgi:hypothetical protein